MENFLSFVYDDWLVHTSSVQSFPPIILIFKNENDFFFFMHGSEIDSFQQVLGRFSNKTSHFLLALKFVDFQYLIEGTPIILKLLVLNKSYGMCAQMHQGHCIQSSIVRVFKG